MKGFSWWDALQGMEAKVVGRVRAAVFLFGAMGQIEAHAIATELAFGPAVEMWLRRIFVTCMGISLLLRAGDKTPENVKQLAASQPGQTP